MRFGADGLVPCVVQEAAGGEVLMVAYADRRALAATLATGEAHFWSRSRRELWHKGASSGNVQRVLSVRLDCDHDAVLLAVVPAGPACHTGAVSCFRDEASGGAVVELRDEASGGALELRGEAGDRADLRSRAAADAELRGQAGAVAEPRPGSP